MQEQDLKQAKAAHSKIFIVVIISFAMIGLIGSLLGTIYMSRAKLYESTLKQLNYDAKELAVPINRFYSERKDDLKNIVENCSISEILSANEALREPTGDPSADEALKEAARKFSANEALKEYPKDGYPSVLELISEKFEDLLKNKKFYKEQIYIRFVFSDTKGRPLVEIPSRLKKKTQSDWRQYLTPEAHKPFIISKSSDKFSRMMVSIPFFIKEHYLGQIFADISSVPIHKYLSETEKKLPDCMLGLVSDNAIFLQKKTKVPSKFSKTGIGEYYRFGTGSGEMVGVRTPVRDTLFSMAMIVPVSHVFTLSAVPWHLPLALGLLVTGFVIWRINTRNAFIHADIAESGKKKKEIFELSSSKAVLTARVKELDVKSSDLERRNAQLESICDEQKLSEKKFEQKFAMLNSEFEEVRRELLSRSMEAGRAHLSDMALHNINNALTPMKVRMDSLETDESEQVSQYLEKCYADLSEHAGDIQKYIIEDPRGKEVFRYMGTLIDSLKNKQKQTKEILGTLEGTISHACDILTLQETFAGYEKETKKQVSLNDLAEFALRIQAEALQQRNIIIKKELTPDLPKKMINHSALAQVIADLIRNSYEAIDRLDDEKKEKQIRLRTFAGYGQIGLEITDSGIGLEPEEIDTAFELGKSGKDFSGLGIAYCRMFAQANGGTLDISSPGKGKGAATLMTFKV
ncbi:HAMP domain-containing sensor histidine kinase [Desulfococcaceae bacterium HSG8]|nr:HAMP domain-containing sensor histidine kinase [Desulfococcaceae bacterium HSG8]